MLIIVWRHTRHLIKDKDHLALLTINWLTGEKDRLFTSKSQIYILAAEDRVEQKESKFWGRIKREVQINYKIGEFFLIHIQIYMALDRELLWKPYYNVPFIISDNYSLGRLTFFVQKQLKLMREAH